MNNDCFVLRQKGVTHILSVHSQDTKRNFPAFITGSMLITVDDNESANLYRCFYREEVLGSSLHFLTRLYRLWVWRRTVTLENFANLSDRRELLGAQCTFIVALESVGRLQYVIDCRAHGENEVLSLLC